MRGLIWTVTLAMLHGACRAPGETTAESAEIPAQVGGTQAAQALTIEAPFELSGSRDQDEGLERQPMLVDPASVGTRAFHDAACMQTALQESLTGIDTAGAADTSWHNESRLSKVGRSARFNEDGELIVCHFNRTHL